MILSMITWFVFDFHGHQRYYCLLSARADGTRTGLKE